MFSSYKITVNRPFVDLKIQLTVVCTLERSEALIVAVAVVVVVAVVSVGDDEGVVDFSLLEYGLNLADFILSAMMEGRMPEVASMLV